MGDTYPKLRVAAVQAAPVFLDREATVEKACRLIQEAGASGARLVGFPEGFIPTHPIWFNFHAATSRVSFDYTRELFKNAVVIPSKATEALCDAAREAGCYVVMGLCEKTDVRMGTMYNTQLFISPTGEILGKHQKLVPTLAERLVHTGGSGDTLHTFDTDFGTISGLMCGENSNPLAAFTLDVMGTIIHVASWPPSFFGHVVPMQEIIGFTTRALAHQLKAFVINSVGTISDEMIDQLPLNGEDRELLVGTRELGGASVIGPNGEFVAGPMGPGEGLLYADIDLERIIAGKATHDFAGHYNRFDLFTVSLDTRTQPNLRVLSDDEASARQGPFPEASAASSRDWQLPSSPNEGTGTTSEPGTEG